MIIQSIAILDQLDKDINTFAMRIREWYGYHFPELVRIIPDNYVYTRIVNIIGERKTLDEGKLGAIKEILEDDEKVNHIIEAARTSIGMERCRIWFPVYLEAPYIRRPGWSRHLNRINSECNIHRWLNNYHAFDWGWRFHVLVCLYLYCVLYQRMRSPTMLKATIHHLTSDECEAFVYFVKVPHSSPDMVHSTER